MPSDLMFGSKTAPINLKVTEKFKLVLRQNWDFDKFPNSAKKKPNPIPPPVLIPFESEIDFITTVLRKEFLKSKFKFHLDLELNNPDF